MKSARPSCVRRSLAVLFVACAAVIVVVGCGKANPAEPSNSGPGGTGANTFIGVVSAPGGAGGTVQLRAASSLSSLARVGRQTLFARVLSLFEPVVLAQSSTASGIFIGDNGQVASLSGSFGGNTFSVSGGGFSITATVAGTSLSGTATLPGGQTAAVTASAPVSAPSPPPAIAAGFYDGSYRIDADATYRNTLASDGSLLIQCTYQKLSCSATSPCRSRIARTAKWTTELCVHLDRKRRRTHLSVRSHWQPDFSWAWRHALPGASDDPHVRSGRSGIGRRLWLWRRHPLGDFRGSSQWQHGGWARVAELSVHEYHQYRPAAQSYFLVSDREHRRGARQALAPARRFPSGCSTGLPSPLRGAPLTRSAICGRRLGTRSRAGYRPNPRACLAP